MKIFVRTHLICRHQNGHYAKFRSKMPYIHHTKMFQNLEDKITLAYFLLCWHYFQVLHNLLMFEYSLLHFSVIWCDTQII
jgi:hypothetical protein